MGFAYGKYNSEINTGSAVAPAYDRNQRLRFTKRIEAVIRDPRAGWLLRYLLLLPLPAGRITSSVVFNRSLSASFLM